MNTPTPTPRTDAASALTSQHRHDDLFGDPEFGWVTAGFARTLERELATLTTERDQLRAEVNEAHAATHHWCNRAERAEDNLAALEQCHDDNCRGVVRIDAELAKERARLDWLQEHALAQHSEGISISKLGKHYNGFPGSLRAAIDAAMKGEA